MSVKSKYTSTVVITMSPDQKKAIQKQAKKLGQSMATYMRSKSLEDIELESASEKNHHPLRKFAGILSEDVADKYIRDISDKISKD